MLCSTVESARPADGRCCPLLPQQVYTVYANTRDEQDYTWHEVNKRLGEAKPATTSRTFGDGKDATSVDYCYKVRGTAGESCQSF
jgi:hypothetical protein